MISVIALTPFIYAARSLVLERFEPDTCILTTAVIRDVLKFANVEVKPMIVEVQIYNPAFVACVERKGGFPESAEEGQRWTDEHGARIMLLQKSDPEHISHLVGILRDASGKAIMIDGSLDQSTRPQYGMELAPFAMHVSDEFVNGVAPLAFFTKTGCAIKYKAFPDNKDFATTPDWIDQDRRREIVNTLLAEAGSRHRI